MAKLVTVRPGQKVEIAGQYVLADADCRPVLKDGKPTSEYTLSEGDKAPPTPEKGQQWLLVDASRHVDTPADVPVAVVRIPGMPVPARPDTETAPEQKGGGEA